MATGLMRVIEAANRIAAGEAQRGVAHASSGAAPAAEPASACWKESD